MNRRTVSKRYCIYDQKNDLFVSAYDEGIIWLSKHIAFTTYSSEASAKQDLQDIKSDLKNKKAKYLIDSNGADDNKSLTYVPKLVLGLLRTTYGPLPT